MIRHLKGRLFQNGRMNHQPIGLKKIRENVSLLSLKLGVSRYHIIYHGLLDQAGFGYFLWLAVGDIVFIDKILNFYFVVIKVSLCDMMMSL